MRTTCIDPYTDIELITALFQREPSDKVLWTGESGIMHLAAVRLMELRGMGDLNTFCRECGRRVDEVAPVFDHDGYQTCPWCGGETCEFEELEREHG